jgi:8-oxo-dGTP diphosphatase
MKKLRIIARVLVIHDNKILLARNRGAKFWYPPGGGWEYEVETIKECAAREVIEETGYHVDIKNLVWTQEFRDEKNICFETFWRGELASSNPQDVTGLASHIDLDENGAVEEVRWFSEDELVDKKVLPKVVKDFGAIREAKADFFLGSF